MKKNTIKILTCFLLAGLLVSCVDNNVSPSNDFNSTPSDTSSPSNPSTPVDSSTNNESSTPEESTTIENTTTPEENPTPDILTPGEGEEVVNYVVNVSDEFEAGTNSDDQIKGKFTLVGGTEVRNRTKTWINPDDSTDKKEFTKSIKLGSSSSELKVDVPGRGMLYLWVQNGSSAANTQKISVTGPDGKEQQIEFVGTDQGNPVVRLDIEVGAGVYSIKRVTGTVDIFNMELKCVVEKSEESGFAIASKGQVDFLEGENFDESSLQLNKVYGNGRLDVLPLEDENVTIDSSAYNPNVPGTYTIKINYKEYAQLTYDVVVYDIEGITLGFDSIEKLKENTSAGNGVYFNHSVKEVYEIGEEFDTSGLSVIINAKNGETTKQFKANSNITYTGFDSTTAGKKDVTVTYSFANQTVTETLSVYVVDAEPVKTVDNVVKVKVDPSYDGTVGEAVSGYNTFTTIQQALDFIEGNKDILATDRKLIELTEGTYTEKLEITIPYLTIKGSNAKTTIIEWDSLYGVNDAGGFSHTTDSTQTVAVREEAIGVTFEGITISNWYNSQERFNQREKEIERALALLVQADQFTMKDSQLLGVQDTLELFKGRQYFENVFISGYTDFIFGTNNTTYFTDCTIHTIDTGKDAKGTNGYITAFKGCNKGDGDYIKYGAIFDGCNFTADEGLETKQSIGRTWGKYAAVAVINSEIGGHISTAAFTTSTNKELRYTSMNGILPTDETVQFVEYNNIGLGAVSTKVDGMELLTVEEAANYSNFDVIFGTTNAKVTYDTSWNPNSTEIQIDKNIYYHFDGKDSITGTSYSYTGNTTKGSTSAFENIYIDATEGKVQYQSNSSSTEMSPGAKLVLNVEAGTTVTVTTYPGYHEYSLNGVETTSDTFSQHYSSDTTLTLEALNKVYLYSIVVKPEQPAPSKATLESLEINGQTTIFTVGNQLTYEDLVVKASYSDSSLIPLSSDQYEVTWNGDINVADEYTVTVTYGDVNKQYTVRYVEEGVDPSVISKDTTISFGTNGNYKTSQLIVADGTTVRDNGGDNTQLSGTVSIKALAEATITINGYPSYTNYQVSINSGTLTDAITDSLYTITLTEDATVDFVCGSNHYFKSIVISYPVVYSETTTINLLEFSDTIQNSTTTWKGLEIDASNGKFGNNNGSWLQVNANTIIKLNVVDGASVTVTAYNSADNFSIVVANGIATITCNVNDYLNSISITYTE